jgi:hypothetical protein
MEEMVDRIGE